MEEVGHNVHTIGTPERKHSQIKTSTKYFQIDGISHITSIACVTENEETCRSDYSEIIYRSDRKRQKMVT